MKNYGDRGGCYPSRPFTAQHVVIAFPERTPDCPEPKAFQNYSHKKRIIISMTRQKDERLVWPERIGALLANRCAVHRYRRVL